jgi:anti-sigma B factor antagonist
VGDRVEFAIAVEAQDGAVAVRVDGELDMANVGSFEDALAGAMASTHVIVDLTGCTFLDSAAMRAIASAVREARRLSIVATDPAILRVLEITALDTVVSIHPSLDDALATD